MKTCIALLTDFVNFNSYLFSAVRNNVFRALKKDGKFIPISDLIVESRLHYPDADAELLKKEFFRTYDLLIQSMPRPSKRFSGCGIMKIFLRWRLQKS